MIKSILEDFRSIKSNREDLKKFGLTMAAVLAVIAAVSFFRKREAVLYASAALSAFFLFWALAFPPFLRVLHRVWMGIAVVMGFVMSRIILSVLFFLAITPIAILLKCLGKDILSVKRIDGHDSYWADHASNEINKESYERQY